jgi:hypothetical protein
VCRASSRAVCCAWCRSCAPRTGVRRLEPARKLLTVAPWHVQLDVGAQHGGSRNSVSAGETEPQSVGAQDGSLGLPPLLHASLPLLSHASLPFCPWVCGYARAFARVQSRPCACACASLCTRACCVGVCVPGCVCCRLIPHLAHVPCAVTIARVCAFRIFRVCVFMICLVCLFKILLQAHSSPCSCL